MHNNTNNSTSACKSVMTEDRTSDESSSLKKKYSDHLSVPHGSLVTVSLKQNGTVVPASVEIVLTAELQQHPHSRGSKSSSVGARSLRSLLRRVHWDWLLLSVVLVIVWGLLILPIIYFHTEIVSPAS